LKREPGRSSPERPPASGGPTALAMGRMDALLFLTDINEKEKFLVITSFDIKTLYFFKRHFFPVYHYVMKKISRLLNSMKD
jgi:hypothetical protein